MTITSDRQLPSQAFDRTEVKSAFLACVFFVSGFPALIYQLTWQRSLFTIYGINIEAVTIVVAGFLLGLGFGSLVGGRLSRAPTGSLLALFGTIETGIGLFGVISLRVFAVVGEHTLFLPVPGTTLAVMALLFVPTLLMGSTLPILAAYLVRRTHSVGRSVGLLYCANTLGSAIACFACAFGLMRLLGMQGAINLAASINLAIGAAALIQAYRTRSQPDDARAGAPPADAAPTAVRSHPGGTLVAAIALAALIGFVSLSYEILWFRAFVLANNTAGAFALVLGTYLAGIANGSLRARRLFDKAFSARRAALTVAVALLVASLIGFALLPLTAASALNGFGYFYPMLGLLFVQASVLGALFPIVCDWSIRVDRSSGERLGYVYLGNVLGSVAGTLATGFLLMDCLPLASVALTIVEIGIAIAVLLGLFALAHPAARLALIAGGLAAALMPIGITGPLFAEVYEALTYKAAPAREQQFTDVVENKSGVITVNRGQVVYGGGAYDGIIALDMLDDPNLLIRPYSLSLFHRDPQNVLMIGLATGAWAQVIANHPAVKHLTVVEINPGYLPIIERHPVVAGLLANPKVSIVIDDGRRWLNRHPAARFDAIIQNTTWNYRPNVTNLLSAEYLRLLQRHLLSGGIALYNTTGSIRAQRTACEIFADGYRELNVMVVANQELRLDHDRLRAVLAAYRIDDRPVFDVADPRYRARLEEVLAQLDPQTPAGEPKDAVLEPCRSILTRARAQGAAPISDDNMGEEWSFIESDPMLDRLRRLLTF
jgi:spermidine synthase